MKLAAAFVALWGATAQVSAVDPTDTLMDGDSAQSGYLPNHNMDPNVITGGSFGQIWQFKASATGGSADQFYAKPLVYTPSDYSRQVVLVFSEANRIYVLDAQNGTLINSRDLSSEGEGPFKVSDLPSCNDIGQNVGITGTPVIDPSTNTVFFWAKSYMVSGQTGLYNGAYRFHAVDTVTLAERPGYPTNIQNSPADNDNSRWFHGGTHLQRASLNLVNGVVFAGFGGHCDLFNYTGWVVGMSSTSGNLITAYSTSAGAGAPPQDGTWTGGGGGCGVWMAGSAIASDNSGRIFFATGNAKGGSPVNQQAPASGRVHLDTLSESIVNLAVDARTGLLTQQDYFEPATYLAMDAGDRDLGAGGVCLPDPTVFSGGGISRLAITCGKNGVCFVANADNLGGYKMASSSGDAIIQTITPPGAGSIFGNPGAYPLEGGYLYVTPVGSPTYAYALGFDVNSRPTFTLVGQTLDSSPGAVGAGPGTITSFKGQAGTGILWIADTNGLRAYGAVPINGILPKITIPAMPAPPKFSRPSFGDGRYYLGTFSGTIVAFGAPVALPLTCSSPLEFGSVGIGLYNSLMATCTANIAIIQVVGLSVTSSIYQAQNVSLPKGSLKAGDTFSFPVTFNLTAYVLSAGSSSAPSVIPGVQSAALALFTENLVAGYSSQQSISLTGTVVSQDPWLSISPLQVNFPGLVIGSASAVQGSGSTFIIQNVGKADLTILGYAFSNDQAGPYTNITVGGVASLDVGSYFTTQDLPTLGAVILSGGSTTVSVLFNTTIVGSFYSILTIFSDGGSAYVILSGAANTLPIALMEQSTNEGGWITIPDCPVPADGCTVQVNIGTLPNVGSLLQTIRITNNGGSNLVITKSKPPVGSSLGATNPSTDFSEGLTIPPGSKASATVYFQPGPAPLNSDPAVYFGAWTLNTNDLAFGVHVLNFTATLAAPQVGPLLVNGASRFKYLGCFSDGAGARIEPTQINNVNNTNGICQQQALTGNYPFAGTEYQTECWVGYVIPPASARVVDSLCTTYTCPTDKTQFCGGFGGYLALYYDSLKYFPATQKFAQGYAPPGPPSSVGSWNYVGCYSDTIASRTLSSGNVGIAKTNSLENCAASCGGYSYFGAEYGTECFCGNAILNGAVLEPDSQCSMICPGNTNETCGAGSRLTLYAFNSTLVSSSSSSTINSPISTPQITSSSSARSNISSGTNLISTSPPPYTSTLIISPSSTTPLVSSTASNSATSNPFIPAVVGNYSYVECRSDNTTIRTLQSKYKATTDMTIERCMGNCTGYTYFGLEYSTECRCGNSLTFGSYPTTDGRCKMLCGGSTNEICGGASGMTLYVLNNNTIPLSSALPPSSSSLNSVSSSLSSTLVVATTSSSLNSSLSIILTTTSVSSTSSGDYSVASPTSSSVIVTTPSSLSSSLLGISPTASISPTSFSSGNTSFTAYSSEFSTYTSLGATASGISSSLSADSTSYNSDGSSTLGRLTALNSASSSVVATTSSSLSLESPGTSLSTSLKIYESGTYLTSYNGTSGTPSTTSAIDWTSSGSGSGSVFSTLISTTSIAVTSTDSSSDSSIFSDVSATSSTTGSSSVSDILGSTTSDAGSASSTIYGVSSTVSATISNSFSPSIPLSTAIPTPSLNPTSSSYYLPQLSSSSPTASPLPVSVGAAAPSVDNSSSSSPVEPSSDLSSATTLQSSLPSTEPEAPTSSSNNVLSTATSSNLPPVQLPPTVLSSTSGLQSFPSTVSSPSGIPQSTMTSGAMPMPSTSTQTTPLSTVSSSSAIGPASSITSSTLNSTPSTWTYAGCANDTSANRALSSLYTYGLTMSVGTCQSTCLAAHYGVAGLEAGNQCFCGLSLAYNSSVGKTGCITPCVGNTSQICGGSQRLSVYNLSGFVTPEVVKIVGAYGVAGCYLDSVGARVLTGYSFSNANGLTVQNCVSTCQSRGYGFSGVEYSKQCFCGSSLVFGSTKAPLSDCMISFCSGNSTQFCGASGRLLVYST